MGGFAESATCVRIGLGVVGSSKVLQGAEVPPPAVASYVAGYCGRAMSQHNMEMVRSAYERFQATGDYLAWIVKLDRATRMEMYAHPLEVLAAARLRE